MKGIVTLAQVEEKLIAIRGQRVLRSVRIPLASVPVFRPNLSAVKKKTSKLAILGHSLFDGIKGLIEQARGRVAWQVNSEATLLYWNIGHRINTDILKNKRADYGLQVVASLAQQLREEYGGTSFDLRNLRRMMQFAESFPDLQIVSPLATQLSWSHFIEVLPFADATQREFYLTMAMSERWSRQVMRDKIGGMLYERTLIAGKPEKVIKQLDNSGIRVAEYLTELPSKKLLQRELQQSLKEAKEKFGAQSLTT